MKLALSHPTGNQNVRGALTALHREGALARFYTTIGWSDDSPLLKLASANLRRKLGRRSYPVPPSFIRNAPLREFLRLDKPFGMSAPIDAAYFHLDQWDAGQ